MFPDLSVHEPIAPALLRAVSLAVWERRVALRAARRRLHVERTRAQALRVAEGEVDEALRRAIEGLRDAVSALGGREACGEVFLGGPLPPDVEGLIALTNRVVQVLDGPTPPALRASGRVIDLFHHLDRIELLCARLNLEYTAKLEQEARLGRAQRRCARARFDYQSGLRDAVSRLLPHSAADAGPAGQALAS